MHECPFCGEECDCDLDDCGGLPVPDDCPHVCADPDYDEDDDDLRDEDIMDSPHYYAKTFKAVEPLLIETVEFTSFNEVEAWFYRKASDFDVCVVFENDHVCQSAVDYTRDEYEPLIHLRHTSRLDTFQPYRLALRTKGEDNLFTWKTNPDELSKAETIDSYAIQALTPDGEVEHTIYLDYWDQVQRNIAYRVMDYLADVYDAARLMTAARVALFAKETALAQVIVEHVESALWVTAERNL